MMTKEVFDRIVAEYAEVAERLQKLHTFITDEEKMKDIDQINQDLLVAQMNAMGAYSSILRIRLGINNRPEFATPAEGEAVVDAPEETTAEVVSE